MINKNNTKMTIAGKNVKIGDTINQAGRWIKVEKISDVTKKAVHVVGTYIDEPEVISKAYGTLRKETLYKSR